MAARRLFALLVGIREYQHLSSLRGPEDDVDKMLAYLREHASDEFQIDPVCLYTADATKEAIVSHFRSHLIRDDAVAQDVALFYFSGHGGQEKADPVFYHYEPERMLESLACYDSNPDTAENLLADKELRYLLKQVADTGMDVVTIFDCCHSGDNTRAFIGGEMLERKISKIAPVRNWDQFIFHQEIPKSAFNGAPLNHILPEGRHIALAACEDFESAYDLNGGVFTRFLLEVLRRAQGDISYYDIQRLIRNKLRDNLPQSPKIYVGGDDPKDAFKSFLSGITKDKPKYGFVYFNQLKNHWEIDFGGIHGVHKYDENGDPQQVVVHIAEGETCQATIEEVFSAHSAIKFEPYADIAKKESYEGYIPGILIEEILIYPKGDQEGVDKFLEVFKANEAKINEDKLFLAESEEKATFAMLAADDHYQITATHDHRPLVEQVPGYSAESAEKVLRHFKHISHWYFVKMLKNPHSKIHPERPIQLTLIQNGKRLEPDEHGRVYLEYDDPTAVNPQGSFRGEIRNLSRTPLFVCGIYLTNQFGIMPYLLRPYVKRLGYDDEPFPIYNGEPIPIKLDDYLRDFNWKEDVLNIQFLASTVDFTNDIGNFEQEELNKPIRLTRSRGDVLAKSMDLKKDAQVEVGNDWTTQFFELRIRNPFYKEG